MQPLNTNSLILSLQTAPADGGEGQCRVWMFVMYVCTVCRCRQSVEFSIRTAWLIGAYAADVNKPRWKTSQGMKLRKMILHEELRSVTFSRINISSMN